MTEALPLLLLLLLLLLPPPLLLALVVSVLLLEAVFDVEVSSGAATSVWMSTRGAPTLTTSPCAWCTLTIVPAYLHVHVQHCE
jgi:hypothetical protein